MVKRQVRLMILLGLTLAYQSVGAGAEVLLPLGGVAVRNGSMGADETAGQEYLRGCGRD